MATPKVKEKAPPSGPMTIEVVAKSTRPLLMHNGQLARPHGKFSAAIKAISGKKNKTEADHAEMARIEWRGGWHSIPTLDPFGPIPADAQPSLPLEAVESMLAGAATNNIKGGKKLVQAAIVCTDVAVTIGDGLLQSIAEMEGVEEYMDQRMARVQASRVLRTRPRLERWGVRYVLSVTDRISFDQVEMLAGKAGDIGLGDWRPRYGTHVVLSVKRL